jgi:tyrosine-protein phosphatase SIW14
MRLSKSIVSAWCVGVVLALTAATAAEELRQAVSHRDEKSSIEGVENFGRMNDRLYRGAQPTDDGFRHLRDLGIGTVVRLSLGDEGSRSERALVKTLGMRFIGLPWSSARDPQADQVVEFLTFAEMHPNERIFVHCKAGADRTGVFVALYRIVLDRWSAAEAIDEMKAFHYRYVFLPHLQSYVEAFPGWLRTDPRFEPLATR